jgi:hypothetical protein
MNKMIPFFLINLVMFFFGCETETKKTESLETCFIGKLVKKGICMNYVIEVMDENFDKNLIEINWFDDLSNQEYKNVFTLASVCDFPNDIMEGEIFNFSVLENYNQQCAVCLAYTPTPEKSINIRLC